MVAMLRPEKIYIFRSSPKGNYMPLINEVVNDSRLKHGLLELMVYMLSKPPTWKINTKELSNRFDLGLDTINKRLNELSRFGYVKRVKVRSARGIYTEIDVYVTDEPKSFGGFNPDLEKPSLVKPGLVKARLSKTDLSKTDLNKTSLKKSQSSYIGNLNAREELANRITVRKPTPLVEQPPVVDDSIFKKKTWREQLENMRGLSVPPNPIVGYEAQVEDRRRLLEAQFELLMNKQSTKQENK
jgi:hypothetical protein